MRSRRDRVALVFLAVASLLVGVAAQGPTGCAVGPPAVEVQQVITGLLSPMYVTAPLNDPRLFVVERAGRILIVEDGTARATPFLDIRNRVSTESEGGLLGLAFPPDYHLTGRFYVYYSNCDAGASEGAGCTVNGKPGRFRSILSRFRTSSDPNIAGSATEEKLFDLADPYLNHNGGTIAFHPKNGLLYVGLGDGGSGNDPEERAQNRASLLGKILRLNVHRAGAYVVPPTNPFVGVPGALGEIWSLGLRNPYRFAFDRETGDLWIGDVGQGLREEVDFEPAGSPGGLNYGWDVMEGTLCNAGDPAPSPACNAPVLTPPVHEYAHSLGCAIVGGSVYRGSAPDLQGLYLYADYCEGTFYAFDPATRIKTNLTSAFARAAGKYPTSLSEDGFGEMYITNFVNGTIYRVHSTLRDSDEDGVPDVADNCVDLPNGPLIRDPGGNVQLDSDGDGYGNLCDCDLDNDGVVSFTDLAIMKRAFFAQGGPADHDGSGVVNFSDLARMKGAFFGAPGPAAGLP